MSAGPSRLKWAVGLAALLVAISVTSPAAQQPDRSQPPMLSAPPGLKVPPIQKRVLRNGVPVWFIESHEVPLVQVNLLISAGAGDDPVGQFGVASLTAAMLMEGAGARSSLAIDDEVDFLGASLTTASSFDASAVRLNAPVAQLGPALAVMADVALRPTFPQAELDRVRKERITSLQQARDDAESVVPLAFQRAVFGSQHRYGTAATGTESGLAALTTADLRAFHQRWYQPSQARLIVVGDITAADAVARLDRAFGAWTAGTPVRRTPLATAPQVQQRQIVIVDMPEAAQSQIRIGWVGVSRATPDFFPIEVLNTVLGGSFSSRLNQNLREEHQYTYGAASRFDMRRSAGPFLAAAGVQTDKTAEALREFFKELDRIKDPIPDDELARAKNYLALGFPADFETARDLAIRLEELAIYNLPDTYFTQYIPSIQGVTEAQTRAVAMKYLDPNRFAVVVVGDRKVIEPGIRALNLAPVRVLSVQEALDK